MTEWGCAGCGSKYETRTEYLQALARGDECDGCAILPEECQCYKCDEPKYKEDEHGEYIVNNMEYHTYGEPCDDCGTARTEYLDLGRKGRYVCPECR